MKKIQKTKLKHDASASTNVNTTALDKTMSRKSPLRKTTDMFERETEDDQYINEISIINSGSFKLDKQIEKILGE